VLLGHPVAHSRSPAFQNAALAAAGLAARYEAIDVTPGDLSATLTVLRSEAAAGNVTIPHKEAVFRACDRTTDLAQATGAVNTFWVTDRELWGDNTDVAGFETAVAALGVDRAGAEVVCFGAGGAAAAVCAAVAGWPGAHVRLVARSPDRARSLVARFPATASLAEGEALTRASLVVNATPIGMAGEAMPCDVTTIPRDAGVMDLVYRDGETPWVRAARAAGLRAADGLEMLLAQGARAFERWFGIAPDMAAMRRAVTR
jgi:shikimate dehydrogenase